ncbi:MAG: hypothetical protein ACK4ZD_05205 [Caldimonas sp.]|uniref:hypothetical protein n=1 Tax=Caldimonas sp. TaxID=2838790 RepID=UPI00391D1886
MFSFTSKSSPRTPRAARGNAAASDDSGVSASGDALPTRRIEGAAEKTWWMDSAHELEKGLEVTEITDLPDDLFSPAGPR